MSRGAVSTLSLQERLAEPARGLDLRDGEVLSCVDQPQGWRTSDPHDFCAVCCYARYALPAFAVLRAGSIPHHSGGDAFSAQVRFA